MKFCVVKITQGGGVAAPIGAQIFGEVLPYLEVLKDGEKEEDKVTTIEVPNVQGVSIKEATKILKDVELEVQLEEIEGLDKENTIINKQTPSAGIIVNRGSKVYLDY